MSMQHTITDVRAFLPQRPPFLFADEARVDTVSGRAWTSHTFLSEEPYFAGHFPGDPIVPGVVLLEGMAQASRLLLNVFAGRVVPGFLVKVESAKFNLSVRPEQKVVFDCRLVRGTGEIEIGNSSGAIHAFKCAAFLGEERCARAQLNLYQVLGRHQFVPVGEAA